MSREWRRIPADTLCGYCVNRIIPKGEPALFIALAGVKRERIRCQTCAGEAVPDLPARVVVSVEEFAQRGFAQIANNRPKTRGELHAAAREWMPYRDSREPGEEG